MPTATVYFVVLRSEQYPGLNRDVFGPVFRRARAERAAENARERTASYERIEILEEEHSFIEDPELYDSTDYCLCCGLLRPKRPALPAWMTPAKEDA